ncbi:SDR family oxidoreductase [uncultured Microbacterium sp.]|uniref:Putative NAD(P)H azoreductase n=1 Tax=uncultured Microbacterium sp. TaxID=191216 RepID=A0A1Y5NZG8_9MICO|nr:NAD(P)H-binding protein [uncultured Microbacterium sp.]SBS71852.1 putative NAD(P)H azoreductase [uncultured Microbacterium sp.]
MILIVGASGALGGQIVDRLLERGERLRLVARTDSRPTRTDRGDVEHVAADLKDPESLLLACEGVETVITTANAAGRRPPDTVQTVDHAGNENLIHAAEVTDVKRFLFISALGAHPNHPMPILAAKGATEQRLRESRLESTVLQPATFMDLLIPLVVAGPAQANRPVTLIGSGQRKHSFVASADVAAYAVAALTHPEARDQTIVVGGPTPLTWRDVVAAFEDELGRSLPVEHLPVGEAIPGLPEFVTHLLAALDGYDSEIDMTITSDRYDVRPTPISEFVRDLLREEANSAA